MLFCPSSYGLAVKTHDEILMRELFGDGWAALLLGLPVLFNGVSVLGLFGFPPLLGFTLSGLTVCFVLFLGGFPKYPNILGAAHKELHAWGLHPMGPCLGCSRKVS